MKNVYLLTFLLAIVVTMNSCYEQAKSSSLAKTAEPGSQNFNDYWYAGKAEISSYKLSQSRYGEIHEGKAVLVFVTEDFSKSKQVKLDNGAAAGEDRLPVLKMNFTKKFTTGIYPYSMMLSVFSPVAQGKEVHSPKVTMSSQEWCGQVFSQMNLKKTTYELKSFSYFEREGDQSMTLEKTLLEDELWNKIRLDHKNLPQGEIQVLPGLFHTRLNHKEMKPLKVRASLSAKRDEMSYVLDYVDKGRVLTINFDKSFPHQILSWEEKAKGIRGKVLTTKGVLDKSLMTDYWSKNGTKDAHLRKELNL